MKGRSAGLLTLAVAMASPFAAGQISIEEAQARLKAKLTTRPAGTQPSSEVERLREENLRLRERVMDLQREVQTLRVILSHAQQVAPATAPATTAASDAAASQLVGRWRGGDATAGLSYTLQFNPEGTYLQTFVVYGRNESGHYVVRDDTLEMWGDKAPQDRPHNQYRLSVSGGELKLTPLVLDGQSVKTPRTLDLTRAE